MRRVETTLSAETYGSLEREAGRRGISIRELLRRAVATELSLSARQRAQAVMRGESPYDLPRALPPADTGAW